MTEVIYRLPLESWVERPLGHGGETSLSESLPTSDLEFLLHCAATVRDTIASKFTSIKQARTAGKELSPRRG